MLPTSVVGRARQTVDAFVERTEPTSIDEAHAFAVRQMLYGGEEMLALLGSWRPITLDDVEEAKERLILRRDTHLDQLVDKLKEPRVRRVIEPMLQTEELSGTTSEEGLVYVADLGLIKLTGRRKARIANEIYREIIPRTLTFVTQVNLHATITDTAFHLPDGRLDFRGSGHE